MVILEGKNAENFKKMFAYIPEKIFSSILMKIEKDVDTGKAFLKFEDLDINQSLIVNIKTELVDIENATIEDESFRLPLTKSVKSVLKNFDIYVIDKNLLKGISPKKEVCLSMYADTADDEYDFPDTTEEMLAYTCANNDKQDALNVWFNLSTEEIKEILNCIDLIDCKDDDIILSFSISKNSNSIVVSAKDIAGNNFKYTICNVDVDETFKAKYDKYFISVIKALKDSKLDEFKCNLSNLMFGTSFEDDGVNVLIAVTVFDKI